MFMLMSIKKFISKIIALVAKTFRWLQSHSASTRSRVLLKGQDTEEVEK